MKILPGLTTTQNSDWRAKIDEIDKLGLKELTLFPTCLKPDARQDLYKRLEKTSLENIPHVHLRNDVTCREIEYLINTYKSKIFNSHSEREFPVPHDWSDYAGLICLENSVMIPAREEIERFAGLCVDFAHWENGCLTKDDRYQEFADMCRDYTIGCCHVSAIKKEGQIPDNAATQISYASHWLDDISEVDYMKKYIHYLPRLISIELENPLSVQLKVKKRLESLLDAPGAKDFA